MECPKCKTKITEEMLACPNCNKVLKLECPRCKTINKTNTCKKCGFVIVTKCHNCGKINPTINEKCSKCGFSTYTSAAIISSNIDEFACLTMEFPNLEQIKKVLGSTKLTEKFKANLDKLITDYTGSIGITREIFEDSYIIRFNKDSSFKESSLNAIKAATEIQNLITELNFKLDKLKNAFLECRIAVLKRDIYSKPDEYSSGFNIKLIYDNKKDLRLINCLQVITDSSVYEQVCDDFQLSSLSSSFIKNKMVMFFELNLKKYIKIKKPKEEDDEEKIPVKMDLFKEAVYEEDESDKLYNIDSINFNQLKCTFTSIDTFNLSEEILNYFTKNKKRIIAINGRKELQLQSEDLPNILEQQKVFDKIFRVTCYDEMKYKPYGFFYELIASIYNYSISPRNFSGNNFEIFKEIDQSGFIKDLINLTQRKFPHPEDVRYSLIDIFLNIFASMSKSLIYIENFEKIDDTSYEILQLIFEKFREFDISYIISSNDKSFSLHKDAHFLLAQSYYTEVKLKPTQIKSVIEKSSKKYSQILDSYYLKTIVQNAKGSILYFKNAIDYLLEKELLLLENNTFLVGASENIFIPPTLKELVIKRLQVLSKDKDAYKMLSMLLMIGPAIDLFTIKKLQIQNEIQAIQKLAEKKYIYVYNNTVYIQNFIILKKAFIKNTTQEQKKEIAKELLQKVFAAPIKHPAEIALYKILEQEKQEFKVWEQLSYLNASMGDFGAYLNCSIKLLKLLDNHVSEESQKPIEEYKMEVYENISNLLYKYTPNEIYNISKVILENLEKTINDKKVVDLCNKMLQGCLISGNYSHALELVHKILSKFPNASLDVRNDNFHIAFFLISLIKIEVLFSIGNLKECEEAAEEILQFLSPEIIKELKPQYFSLEQFEEVILDAMVFAIVAKVLLLRDEQNIVDFMGKVEANIAKVPGSFNLLLMLEKLIKGEKVKFPVKIKVSNDKFSSIIFNIIKAFNTTPRNFKKFANDIYQAKISAKMNRLIQMELICDLLIGYSYFRLQQYEKASSIYYDVLETSIKNGLKLVTYFDWYLISMLKLKGDNIDIAFGIANNAIVQLEKDKNSSDFLFFLFKLLLSKILTKKGDTKSAELCLQNATFIKNKYGLS